MKLALLVWIGQTSRSKGALKHWITKQINPIFDILRCNIVGKDQSCPQTLSPFLLCGWMYRARCKPESLSNKTAKPGWYRAYRRTHPVWNWLVWVPVCPSLCLSISASESQTFIKVSYEIEKEENIFCHDRDARINTEQHGCVDDSIRRQGKFFIYISDYCLTKLHWPCLRLKKMCTAIDQSHRETVCAWRRR